MDNEQKPLESQEELNAEKEITVEVSEDTLREKIAEQLGLDPEAQSDILDRAVKLKQDDNKRLSKAIEQKRKYREQLFNPTKKTETTSQTSTKETPDFDERVDKKVTERLEQRDLESLDFPDDIKDEVKRLAKNQGISVREAAKDPYIQFKKAEYDKAERIKSATPSGKSGSRYVVDPSKPLNVADFNFATEEGRKAFQQAKEARRKANS